VRLWAKDTRSGGPSGLSKFRSDVSRDGLAGSWTELIVAKGAQRESWKTILRSQGIP
jgi:hypothetical protein